MESLPRLLAPCLGLSLLLLPACAASPPTQAADPATDPAPPWPVHTLHADRTWRVNLPRGQRMDASALLRRSDGSLLTVNDQSGILYTLVPLNHTNVADLLPLENCLTRDQLARFAPQKINRYDLEGIAEDSQGRLYVCEEANRWILRWDPATRHVDRLEIDWSPVRKWFAPLDLNASFEGIAIHRNTLYVANERQKGRIIAVDLETLAVVDDFTVTPSGSASDDTHFSDLCWADDALWALLRDLRKVVKIDPKTHRILVEFDFTAMERKREDAYGILFAPGFMEGLSVDDQFIWLLSDNNGVGRTVNGADTRPTLFRCPKPKASENPR